MQRVKWARWDFRASPESRAPWVPQDFKAMWAFLARKETRAREDHREYRALRDLQVRPVQLDHLAFADPLALLVTLDHLASLVLLDYLEAQAHRETRV